MERPVAWQAGPGKGAAWSLGLAVCVPDRVERRPCPGWVSHSLKLQASRGTFSRPCSPGHACVPGFFSSDRPSSGLIACSLPAGLHPPPRSPLLAFVGPTSVCMKADSLTPMSFPTPSLHLCADLSGRGGPGWGLEEAPAQDEDGDNGCQGCGEGYMWAWVSLEPWQPRQQQPC